MYSKTEVKETLGYLHTLCNVVPAGRSDLKDALTFAILDLTAFVTYGQKTSGFPLAWLWVKTIPIDQDLKSDVITDWILHDKLYLNYWN